MHLNEADIRRIAEGSRIALTDEQVTAMASELSAILDSLQAIRTMDLSDVEPTFHPIEGLVNVFREDEVVAPLAREVALQNAATVQDGQFLIPTILGGGDE